MKFTFGWNAQCVVTHGSLLMRLPLANVSFAAHRKIFCEELLSDLSIFSIVDLLLELFELEL